MCEWNIWEWKILDSMGKIGFVMIGKCLVFWGINEFVWRNNKIRYDM